MTEEEKQLHRPETTAPGTAENGVRRTMLCVLAALAPSLAMGTYVFGWRVLLLTAVCVASAAASEWGYEKARGMENTAGDLSAAVTGAILACSLPSGIPLWIAALGSFAAVVAGKLLFGGYGKNRVNPAVAARLLLFLLFTKQMTTFPVTSFVEVAEDSPSAMVGPTPLENLAQGADIPELSRMFFGFVEGPAGCVSSIAILLGGGFLIWKKVISPVIPGAFLAAMLVFAFVCGAATGGDAMHFALFHLFAGGAMFAAFFCATDPVTSPASVKGKAVYAAGCGVITMILRLWGPAVEGVSAAILVMNLLAPWIDRACAELPHGENGKEAEKDE